MTYSDFYMDVKTKTVSNECRDGNMHMSAEILVDDFAFALIKTNDNLDYLAKPVKDELIQRAMNAWTRARSQTTIWQSSRKSWSGIL